MTVFMDDHRHTPYDNMLFNIRRIRGLVRQCYDCMKQDTGCCDLVVVRGLQQISKAPLLARKALLYKLNNEEILWFFPTQAQIDAAIEELRNED